MNSKTVIYINYSPYENSGHILDYLKQNFKNVFLFSLAFHSLNGSKQLNKLTIFQNNKLVREELLFYLNVPQSLVFFFIPIRSVMNLIQIVWKIIYLRYKYGQIDYFFTVNAFTSSIGKILKKINLIKKNIFWVWDYYPVNHPKITFKIMRWLYWQFDKFATYSDRVIYLNHRLADVRKDLGIIKKNTEPIIIPIGTGELLPQKKKNLKKIKIGFIGVLKQSQGIDMLLDAQEAISKNFKNLSFEIIGSGPDEKMFSSRVKQKNKDKFNFHGLVSDERFKEILYDCTIGIAPYAPGDGTVSKYTDPGKPKRYMEFNLPQITTNVIELSKEIEKNKAGIVINYGNTNELIIAIKKIVEKYDYYSKNAASLNKKYYYKNIYKKMF